MIIFQISRSRQSCLCLDIEVNINFEVLVKTARHEIRVEGFDNSNSKSIVAVTLLVKIKIKKIEPIINEMTLDSYLYSFWKRERFPGQIETGIPLLHQVFHRLPCWQLLHRSNMLTRWKLWQTAARFFFFSFFCFFSSRSFGFQTENYYVPVVGFTLTRYRHKLLSGGSLVYVHFPGLSGGELMINTTLRGYKRKLMFRT